LRKPKKYNLPVLALALIFAAGLFGIGLYRIRIDFDVVNALPEADPVVSDTAYIFRHLPIQDQIFIDVHVSPHGLETLLRCGETVEKTLEGSGLFKSVGAADFGPLVPQLVSRVMETLPLLFSREELNRQIEPLLAPAAIRRQLESILARLSRLDGIGQADLIEQDPLGFRNLVLARLAGISPAKDARLYKGKIVSADREHLLVFATPATSGTDTRWARQATDLIERIADKLNRQFSGTGQTVTLTSVGAFRSALDNEQIIRGDVRTAFILATVGIALLLLFAFPRPLLGLLSLIPAVAGSMIAFFFFSLFHPSMSVIVLGFGGAIISITVDHGIAYLLFLDRSHPTRGREASAEVWGVGLLAVLTSVGAFGVLTLSGFPVFEQLGLFTAMGIGFSFLFVHTVFPRVFVEIPGGSARALPLQRVVDLFARSGKPGFWVALILAGIMAFYAKPDFNVSLQAMNTVRPETAAAETLFADVWGGIFNKVYLMTEADTPGELQRKADRLADRIAADMDAHVLDAGFVSSFLFPGKALGQENFAAWRAYWRGERAARVKETIETVSADLGFAPGAFDRFYHTLSISSRPDVPVDIPEPFRNFLGITRNKDRASWLQVSTLTTGPNYDGERFYERYRTTARLFDPSFFSERLGALLFSTFLKLLVVVGISVAVLLFFFFLDLKLTIISLLPVLFALICTLGTLRLIHHPLDIPGLMLSIVVLGMGIDYSLFFVRSFQRYGGLEHPSFSLIRMAVFMASASTLIGFGALTVADHALLRSAGLTSLLGIGYSLAGAFVLLPPILKRLQRQRDEDRRRGGTHPERVLRNYRTLEAYPRLFARFKLRLDPMFSELPQVLSGITGVRIFLDIGSGFGIPAVWFLEWFENARVYGIEPAPERVRIASLAIADRGLIRRGCAPEIPDSPEPADLAVMLDMVHYLDDGELALTLERLHRALRPGGNLILRAALSPERCLPWLWWLEHLRLRAQRVSSHYRTAAAIASLLNATGFEGVSFRPSGGSRDELVWVLGRKPDRPRGAAREH
jgi:uncharacterized protein